MTQCEIVIRLVKGYGWLGIIYDKNDAELYRTGKFHPTATDAFAQTHATLLALDAERKLD